MALLIKPYSIAHQDKMPLAGSTIADNPALPLAISKTFGWEAIRLQDEQSDMDVPACRLGKRVVLLPFFSYGPTLDSQRTKWVLEELHKMGFRAEYRGRCACSAHCQSDKTSSWLHLYDNAEAQLMAFSRGVRNKIRRSERAGIVVRSGNEWLPDFYRLYHRRMHQLGSPALPKKWFAQLAATPESQSTIWCAFLDDKPIAAAFTLNYGTFSEACWVGASRTHFIRYSMYALYWQIIQDAIQRKGEIFSFGRSTTGNSVHRFKQQWGTEDVPLYWNYSSHPWANFRRWNLLASIWKTIPLFLLKPIEAILAKKVY